MPSIGKLRYVEAPADPRAGSRPLGTLILIHAFPLNARMWEAQLPLAEQGWRVVAPQLRGFDGGTDLRVAESMDDYAGDIVDVMDALNIENAVIGGLSLGGYVTFALFRHAPHLFRGMILADTRPDADTSEAREGRRRMLTLLDQAGVAGVADEMVPKLLAPTTIQTRPEIAERVRALILANPASAIAGAIKALMGRPDSTNILATVHCPTLIVVGAEDSVTPPAISERMHRAVAGSEFVQIPGAGHLSNLEQAQRFNDAVVRFLSTRV